MDSTPIYTELQQKLIDPEENNWGPSAPPEFADALAEGAEGSKKTETKKTTPRKNSASRSGGRRRRAED